MSLTPAGLQVLTRAAMRSSGNICPTPGLQGGAQSLVLGKLERDGFIEMVDNCMTISSKGREALFTQMGHVYGPLIDFINKAKKD